ncbi:sarcolemmal membrane-associated protein isoform X7 [Neophocaena asiaeorientalis asiaeorientalis]|uniref:Sarcolemmal membrane-associated protein n=3 Tax=Odontoceti TaxID=9722 RepID=A0A2U4CCE1_TURTR|nr:sarcolemmal membrane-associated protein isoform X16 [Tursiops truncatus]XP_022428471.1 sarcolemmal membrane-associated protein isoform X7 [Delphinapterus leucas]XP_024602062.1 sarcolemmal membrane-associated protein isoform X7 [Neophocaena asiaeorientalis asiaeorientalis]XP_026976981.1 sarcolemmal membrane-associated protein isoform X22 [Lagenorhynchus obliquidens]XP_029099485.1 sarcolemmal membrane-associated protein isoform X7 [Monodon monoceros]XP_030723365.1 sarcolemmal membrane-associa
MPSALAIFTCRPNSHPFQERHVYLDEPIKIGRSVARCRPAQNNATFDCKVLSRNHALVWFDHKTGKFYLQDTKSSNGTFINSQRLSRGSEESPPCEILSGDIIQFGVDVTENTRKGTVTHGCIVSTIKLFLPDGMEARLRSDVIHAPLPSPVDKVAANTPSMYSQELFQLSQYLQEALHREQMLEQKLATLQRLLAITQEASDTSWQALIDEDRLLSRLEVMGNQLQACSKNQTEDSLRKELIALQEDKHNYETTAKESLRRVLQEKIEVVRKLSEVERSLSNTEDECTHLKEMNERTQEELRELANKYNGAVNEIKDLSDKLKVAEGKQEEIQQKGQAEKKELQHKIDEMEEKEQELQAKIEALQADNDFTNERLTALQGTQVDDFLPKINGSTEKEHLLSKSGGDCTFIHQFIECQKKLIVEGHLTKVVEETKLSKENQARAKESDLSDTLSPSKEKSSDDTTDAQMDEQDLNEPFAKVSLLKDDLQGAQSEIEAKQEIQHLRKELIEAQELARASKQKCFELQALLEEERKAYRNQVEESSKQIQVLQAQLQRLHINIENLREEKDSEITGTRDELLSARDEILLLHQAAEKAASERDTDIASLQEELKKVRAELERWRKAASEYEKEIMSLQNTFQLRCQQCEDQQREEATRLQGELEKLRKEWNVLEAECRSLKKENVLLSSELQRQEKELHNSQKQSLELTSDLSILQMTRKELENQVGSLKEQHLRDSADLKTLLSKAENQAKDVQKEYEKTQTVLSELKLKFEMTEQEKQSITDELKQCKDNLKLLREKGNNPSILQPVPAVFIGLFLAFLFWCFGPLW